MTGAAHARHLPTRTIVAHAHFRIGLEPAAGQHHRLRRDILVTVGTEHRHAGDLALAVLDQFAQAGVVAHRNAVALGGLEQEIDQAPAAADRLHRHAAEEVLDTVHHIGLPLEHRNPAHALLAHPDHGVARAFHQQIDQVGLRQVLGHLHQIVGINLRRERRDVHLLRLGLRQIGQDIRPQVFDAIVNEAESAGGEGGIAAAILLAGLLQHQYLRPLLLGGQSGAQRGIARANHDHVIRAGIRHGGLL